MAAIVDADSHLYELPDLWREHADPADRDDALHFERDDNGWDWVTWRDRRILETWMFDVEWLERQLEMLSSGGIKLGWIPAGLIDGKPPSHPDLEPAWALFDTYGINPVFHVGANPNRPFADAWYEGHHSYQTPLLSFPLLGMDVFVTLLDLILNGVMDRHPNLRWGVMEVMTDWFPMLLRRLDTTRYSEKMITGRNSIELELTPSEYVHRSVRISSFATEKPGETMDRVGPLLMWSADFPHAEGEPHVDVYRRKAGLIADDDADAFWGGNAEFLLGR